MIILWYGANVNGNLQFTQFSVDSPLTNHCVVLPTLARHRQPRRAIFHYKELEKRRFLTRIYQLDMIYYDYYLEL